MSLNDFIIGKELGKGAFGSVYIVKRKQDKKIYAMKQVKIIGLSKKEINNAFNEVRILASLSHKNIIGYKEAFYDNNTETLNIVMEYADDGDLNTKIKEKIKNHKYFEENVIWKTLIQILEGLKYLHKNCIIHRDLKSANIFLTKKGIIKIGDLNVSKIIKSIGMASTQTGTPFFASPEIWNSRPYDYKCDIWSVGCIIYEMARFHVPFRAGSMRELYNNVMRGIYPPIPLKYSHKLKNIIKKIIVVNPELRPSANELLNCDIIKQKIKELNLGNNSDIDFGNNFEEINPTLMNTIKIPFNMHQINKKLPKKKYDLEIKKNLDEILLNDVENSKENYCYNPDYIIKNNLNDNNINQKMKNGKNNYDNNMKYNKENNKSNYYNNRNNMNQQKYNTNNFLSKIFKNNQLFKINNITNLINNNIIIVNNNHNNNSKNNINNNSSINEINNKNNSYNNSNNIFDSNNDIINKNKNSYFKNKNTIPYIPRNNKKLVDTKSKDKKILNLPKCHSIKTEMSPNINIYNSKQINHNIINTCQNNNEMIYNEYENDNIYFQKRLLGKRSFSLNNMNSNSNNNRYYGLKNNKNNSLRISIPKSGRNIKRKTLKQNYSQGNIYSNSILSIDKINNNISTINNNDNENISKIEFNLDNYKNFKINKINDLDEKYKSIITEKNNFNNLLYRNKNYKLNTMNSNLNRHKNIFHINNYKNSTGNNERIIKTDDNNINNIKRESSLKSLGDFNDEKQLLNQRNKRINNNFLQKLFNKQKNNIEIKEERIIGSYGDKPYSHRMNSCHSYINIKNTIFNENNSFGNNISLNNISKIHKKYNSQEKNNTELNQKSSKKRKYLGKYFLPKPPNTLNNKMKTTNNNSNFNLNTEILNLNIKNYNQKEKNKNLYINKNEEKLNLFELNNKKDNYKDIQNKYEQYYKDFKNKIYLNKCCNKVNNLHKFFYDEMKIKNNITEREYQNEHPQLINNKRNNNYHKSITRNNSELSKQFTDFNIYKFFKEKKINITDNSKIIF